MLLCFTLNFQTFVRKKYPKKTDVYVVIVKVINIIIKYIDICVVTR